MIDNQVFQEHWKNYLQNKFGNDIPDKFVINLGEIDFQIPPVMATTSIGFKILVKHNARIGVFS